MSAQRIRPATISDIDALDTIEKAVFTADRISRRSFRTLIDRPTAETLVIEADGQICGYAMILFRAGAALARLYSLAVAPAHGGKGYGKALLGAVAKIALDRGCPRLDWNVLSWNKPAIEFYEGLGATVLSDWWLCRAEGDALPRLAAAADRIF